MNAMLAGLLPLFPLPRVVLLPGLRLGLHLFEPRYRAMAQDVLADGSGFILVRSALETDTDLVPPEAGVHPVGTRVDVLAHERLPDGRYNLLVEGAEAVRIREVNSGRPYRETRWEPLSRADGDWTLEERSALHQALRNYATSLNLGMLFKEIEEMPQLSLPLVPRLAATLDLPHPELQFLLEAGSNREMAKRLTGLLRFAASGRTWPED